MRQAGPALVMLTAAALAAPTGKGTGDEMNAEDAGTMTKKDERTIGTATMANDRTLILDLRAEGPKGATGDARLYVAPSDPRYEDMLKHIGDLKPGQSKLVKPFP